MPLLDQSGKRTTTLIREELGEHAVEPRAVDLLRHDDHAGLRHHFSIRAASVEMVLPVTDSSFVMRFTKGFFWFNALFQFRMRQRFSKLRSQLLNNHGVKGRLMLRLKQVSVAAAMVLISASAMASNFRAADQVYVPVAGHTAVSANPTFISDIWIANLSTTDAIDV